LGIQFISNDKRVLAVVAEVVTLVDLADFDIGFDNLDLIVDLAVDLDGNGVDHDLLLPSSPLLQLEGENCT